MQKISFLLVALCFYTIVAAQSGGISVAVVNEQSQKLSGAMVELRRSRDSFLIKTAVTDTAGIGYFANLPAASYLLRISHAGYKNFYTNAISLSQGEIIHLPVQILQPAEKTLQSVTVTAQKDAIELRPDKTIVNLDAGISNAGTSVMEALEKSPGVTVDKDGNISLKGKQGVLVLIDGKQTYLGAAELATLLNGMSSSGVSQIELMDVPPSRYDAAGNAGVINIKTKKTRQRGFNGSASAAFSQGFYPKANSGLQLTYRTGRWNFFANYSLNKNQQFTRIYALRSYFERDGKTVASLLEQPTFFKRQATGHNLRTGWDWEWSKKTTIGMALSGTYLTRSGTSANTALWMNAARTVDSAIETKNTNSGLFENGGINLNFRHQFSASRELTADVDMLGYRIGNDQTFENALLAPGGYTESSKASIPSEINILSAKADYAAQWKGIKWESGWKSSHITTDNVADYHYLDAGIWKEDLGKSNHFLYTEAIHALYANAQASKGKWKAQGGLRAEATSYKANQLGNAAQKDSSFSRSYQNLFPTAYISFNADSNNVWSFNAGYRIDRPAFQKLNPFLFIINKYTYQQGNPYFKPQYTWNIALNHAYKNWLSTGISYSTTKDYFAQFFPLDSNGIVIYTEGNLGRMQVWGASAGVQWSPAPWWSISAHAVYNYKKMEGLLWKEYKAAINQLTVNWNNNFKFKGGWSAELSGFWASRSQHDIQEVLDPSGQLSIGGAKTVLAGKGTVKLSLRDVFFTQWMKGNTYFQQAHEYFKLTRDTRTATLSFTWRFGKGGKSLKKSEGAAASEKERVSAGN